MGQNPSVMSDAQNFCVYFGKAIPPGVEFNFCPWCGSKLINQRHQEIEFSDIQCSFKEKDMIGSGTYAKVYKGKIRGVDVAIKVPNLEKMLPNATGGREDSASSPSSFISASESEPKGGSGAKGGAAAGKGKGKKKKGFGFFKRASIDKEFGDGTSEGSGVGGEGGKMMRPSLGSSGMDSLSEGGDVHSKDEEDDESFGEDGAEDSAVDKQRNEEEGHDDDDDDDEGGMEADYRHLYSDRFQNFLSEVKMLRELNHPNICLLMGTCFVAQGGKSKLLLIYELMDEDLNSYINSTTKRKEIPTLFQRLKIASQIASGLSWVASKGIIHGDLKPTNILRKGAIYKVTDFGLATFEIRVDDFEGGAPIWSAPELLEKRGDASRAVDVFSFGYLLWHILLWKNEEQLYPNIETTAQLIDTVCVKHELPPMQDLPTPLQDLIHECLAYNDTERPSFNHIIQTLNASMLEAAIPTGDKLARKFWMHFFSSKSGALQESVPTIIFLEKFLRFTGLSSRDPLAEVAKDFFDPEGRGSVTLEYFGRVISLFGPLNEEPVFSGDEGSSSPVLGRSKTPTGSASSAKGSTSGRSSPVKKEPEKSSRSKRKGSRAGSRIFQDMFDLRKEPWFCGAVATEKVMETLRYDRPGSYLVRYSNNPKAATSFCLSRVTKNNHIRHHYIVQRMSDGQKQYGLHVSKTEVIYKNTLGQLLRDPRITAAFFLANPVNKVASFSQPSSSKGNEKNAELQGYLSHWEYTENSDEDPQVGSPPVSMDLGTSPPNFVDLENGPPKPRSQREPLK